MSYTELQVTTNFSFLRGASHPDELVEQAAALGYKEIAITDRNSLAGIVRGHAAAKTSGIRIIPACRIDLLDGPSLLAYPTDTKAYGRLSALLTQGNLRAEKGQCHLYKNDVFEHAAGMKFIALPPASLNEKFEFDPTFSVAMNEYREALGTNLYLSATRSYQGDDFKKLHRLSQLSSAYNIPLVATGDVHYHIPERRQLQDIVTCIREKCTIYTAGYRLHENAERYLKPQQEMLRLFRQYPDAILRTKEIAESCRFSLDLLKYIYPEEITSNGRTPQEELTHLAWQGAREHFGDNIPEKITTAIHYELSFIKEMNYASYFLTVYDIVRFARQQGILCQGRGSAANSTVCYCMGITAVDPTKIDLLFERFISSARNEPPDIDVDFEHERREEVIQYIYEKYGRNRAAIVATVTQQRQKGAIRDVGKAMGLSVDTINRLSASVWEFTSEWLEGEGLAEQGFDPRDPHLRKMLELTRQFIGFPRQLGQHTGGFVITQGALSDLCPILNARMENRTCIEWNKDDIDVLGFLKIDVLALGMLTCIRKAFDLAKAHHDHPLTLASVPQDDPDVYEMIGHADTIGVFQIESRAQQSMLPRLKPTCFYDLVIEVAIVRPGPIQGDMVHPYLRRRNGEEKVTYPSTELKEILGKTLGVPLFQEQAMKIAIVAAGFTASEADELRRSMATFKAPGQVTRFREKLVKGMVAKGYEEEFALRVFKQLEGFGSYGFPESHAASFALLVYVSSWLKCHYPDVFACALLNSLPMGFYQPAQIVIDARKHGVEVRPADVNLSLWDNILEEKTERLCALRLGFRQIKGISQDDVQALVACRTTGYTTIHALRDAGVTLITLEKLADADAFRSMGLDRRQALWEVSALHDRPIGIFTGQPSESAVESQVQLPEMTISEHVVHDYSATTLSLKAHPVSFVREKLQLLHILSAKELDGAMNGAAVKVAGLVLVRQRPGTAKGVCFITIEDETGCSNLVVFQQQFDKYRKEILQARLLMVEGTLQREGEVVHIIVKRCYDLSKFLRQLLPSKTENQLMQPPSKKEEISATLFAEARNFK
ncbi:error-prone DNA polymerase [Chitinophaga ginsengisegetis]|uniref:error-prone DNA polymerase n=1 Tax=Chitinophaga ginsengisegetis TaxID=393003 RepID=UPI000DBA8B92|nr:error-prone DNA polymerase [Chitinophaga ginsengisegetis]MDR6566092.1 error-prone DNA polymerase [Chitinophaga ginsengisegetis]MDR6645821.1 error-prone DNA polymerase [Chitinophaga ginsengisegetis]MDR6651587.1 error-prone DNA polymerase [Chitinophaga ginsengisegetis]